MRRQRPRGTTTREDIVGAALAVIDTVGVDRLTIRSVAKHAGAPPMSLYTHFSNKSELLELIYAEFTRRLYGDPSPAVKWQDDLLDLCLRIRGLLIEHPRWIALLSGPAMPAVVPRRERILEKMERDGMAPEAALAALTSALTTTLGLSVLDAILRAPDGEDALTKHWDRLRDWSETSQREDNRLTRAAVSKLRRLNHEENFLLVIRSLIAGLAANRAGRTNGVSDNP